LKLIAALVERERERERERARERERESEREREGERQTLSYSGAYFIILLDACLRKA